MSDEKLTPEAAVRLLRAKGAELENITKGRHTVAAWYLAADIALIAQLLADHIERSPGPWGPDDEEMVEIGDPLYNEAPTVSSQGYLNSILEVTEFDVGSKEEADYVAALKAECDAYLGQRRSTLNRLADMAEGDPPT